MMKRGNYWTTFWAVYYKIINTKVKFLNRKHNTFLGGGKWKKLF